MEECPNCEGAILDCVDDDGNMKCPRCKAEYNSCGELTKYDVIEDLGKDDLVMGDE